MWIMKRNWTNHNKRTETTPWKFWIFNKQYKRNLCPSTQSFKRRTTLQNQIIDTLLEIIGKFENNKRDTEPVSLINFENHFTASLNKVTDSETDPKSVEKQQCHDNKQQISSKELSENSKEKGSTNLSLVTNSVTVLKQVHKQQSHDDKQKCR